MTAGYFYAHRLMTAGYFYAEAQALTPHTTFPRARAAARKLLNPTPENRETLRSSWRVHCAVCGSSWVGYKGEPPANHPATYIVNDDDVIDSDCPLVVIEKRNNPDPAQIVKSVLERWAQR